MLWGWQSQLLKLSPKVYQATPIMGEKPQLKTYSNIGTAGNPQLEANQIASRKVQQA